MKINKKVLKELQQIYEYSQLLKSPLAPRGDGAKLAVAQEIHNIFVNRVDKFMSMKDTDVSQYLLILMETTEQILLDMLNENFTVEEMELYD